MMLHALTAAGSLCNTFLDVKASGQSNILHNREQMGETEVNCQEVFLFDWCDANQQIVWKECLFLHKHECKGRL